MGDLFEGSNEYVFNYVKHDRTNNWIWDEIVRN